MFGDFLRGYRKAAKLTQERLAEKTGLSRSQINNLERGARGPSPDQLEKLVKALELQGAERTRFVDAGMSARADQDSDLAGFVEELRADNRVLRQRFISAVTLIGRFRDTLAAKGIQLPKDLQDAITELEQLR